MVLLSPTFRPPTPDIVRPPFESRGRYSKFRVGLHCRLYVVIPAFHGVLCTHARRREVTPVPNLS